MVSDRLRLQSQAACAECTLVRTVSCDLSVAPQPKTKLLTQCNGWARQSPEAQCKVMCPRVKVSPEGSPSGWRSFPPENLLPLLPTCPLFLVSYIQSRVYQPEYCWGLGLGNYLSGTGCREGAVSCIVGCLTASVSSSLEVPITFPSCENQKCFQILPSVPRLWGWNRIALVKKHWLDEMAREKMTNKWGNMLITNELRWKKYGSFLYSSYNFPVSLRRYLNDFFKKKIRSYWLCLRDKHKYFEWQSTLIF